LLTSVPEHYPGVNTMKKHIKCLIFLICFCVFCNTPQAISQTISYYATGEEFSGPLPTWKNVKTDFGAKGDGITDDAPAITAALYTFKDIDNLNSSVLYFPAGTYRLSSTILNAGRGEGGSEYAGLAIIGEDPSNTILLWDGSADGTMFRLDGWYLKISRLTFDGQNKAKTGLLRDGYFGTGVEYSDLVFKDLNWGVLLGGESGAGQAENLFMRCRFYNCNCGIYGPNMNSLDIWVWYCLYEDCSYGIHCGGYQAYGNVFLRSKVVDLGLSWQPSCIVNNISVNTESFNDFCNIGFFQGNKIYDPDTTKINWDNIPDTVKAFILPPTSVLLDNTIKTSGNNIAAIKLSSMFGRSISAGNTFTQLWPIRPRNLVRDRLHDVKHAVDGNPETSYIGEFWKIYYFKNPTVGIAWHCPAGKPKVAVKYSLTAANVWGWAPRSVRLVGSNDWGYHSTVLDMQENVSLNTGETRTFTFNNSTPFALYRLDVLKNNSGDTINTGGYFEIAEFKLTDAAGLSLMTDQGGLVTGADEKWGEYYSVQEKQVPYSSIPTPVVIELPETPPLVMRRIFEVQKGTSDDATEIQMKIDSAAAMSPGSRPVVHIPKGIYSIKKTLILPANIDMTFCGDGIFNGGTHIYADPEISGPTIRVMSPSHILVRDLVVGGNEAIYVEVDDKPGTRVTGTLFTAGGGNYLNMVNTAINIDGIEQSDIMFTGITIGDFYNNGVLVKGGPILSSGGSTNGQIAFLSGSAGGQNMWETQNKGKIIAQGMWYEGSYDNTRSFIDLTGISSGSIAISGMTWMVFNFPPYQDRPLVSIDNLQGQFTAVANYFGPWGQPTHWWHIAGDGSREQILSACNDWYLRSDSATMIKWPYWVDETSPSADASRIFCEEPDITNKIMNTLPDSSFMVSSLELMRSLRIKKPTAPVPGESHLDFIRVVAYGTPDGTAVRFISVPDPYGRPGSPTLVSPKNSSTNVGTIPSMRWNASTGASSYRLQVSTSTSFNNIVYEDSTITTTNKEISPLMTNTAYHWRVLAKNSNGSSMWSPVWSFTTGTTTSVEQINSEIPGEFYLGNNYPNPFNRSTSIVYSIPYKGKVTLMLFDSQGREISVLVDQEQIAGKYEVKVDGSKLPGGIYFYRIHVGEYSTTRRMVLIK
jgi:hypothetical protein